MATLEKIKSISSQDLDINLNYGHYKPLAKLINERGYKRVLEIGCAYANLSEHLLDNTDIHYLVSVDPYKAYPDMPGISSQKDYDLLFGYVKKRMKKHVSRWDLVRQTSKDFFSHLVVETDIDLIFIDGLHTYEMVQWEIENYSKLIKTGGILSGHDITVFEGVDRAVFEYRDKTGKQLHTLPGNVWYFEM